VAFIAKGEGKTVPWMTQTQNHSPKGKRTSVHLPKGRKKKGARLNRGKKKFLNLPTEKGGRPCQEEEKGLSPDSDPPPYLEGGFIEGDLLQEGKVRERGRVISFVKVTKKNHEKERSILRPVPESRLSFGKVALPEGRGGKGSAVAPYLHKGFRGGEKRPTSG